MRKANMHGRVARAAVSAALAGIMAFGGVVGPVGTALAAGENQVVFYDHNAAEFKSADTVYTAYRVFNAGDVDPATYVATDVTWVDDAMMNAVLPFLNNNGYATWLTDNGYSNAQSAQNALKFISEKIAEDEVGGGSFKYSLSGSDGVELDIANAGKHVTAKGSFASDLAITVARAKNGVSNIERKKTSKTDYMITNTGAGQTNSSSNTIALNDASKDGYYVLVPTLQFTSGDVEGDEVFYFKNEYSPIWLPYTGSKVQVMMKNYDGTIAKTVKDDATGAVFASVADAAKEQALDFRLTMTLPAPPTGTVTYTAIDVLPAGMEYVPDSAVYYGEAWGTTEDGKNTTGTGTNVGKQSLTPAVSTSGNTLTFTLPTLTTDTKGTVAVIEYKARMVASATTGLAQYNTNRATFKWSSGATSTETTESTANVTAYQLALNLVDSLTGEGIVGTNAKFTIQDENNLYVTSDGRLQGAVAELDMKSLKTLTIPFIDEGTYTVTQIAAPDGYQLTSNNKAKVTITATKEQGIVTKLAAVTEGANSALVSIEEGPGIVTISIPNPANQTIVLPITGMTPSQLGTLVGALLVVGGGAVIVLRRRSNGAAA